MQASPSSNCGTQKTGKPPLYTRWSASRESRRRPICSAGNPRPQVRLLRPPIDHQERPDKPLLVYLPGTDGTGQSLLPQLPGLLDLGYDVRSLYIPPDDRSSWDQLLVNTLTLVQQELIERQNLLQENHPPPKITLLAESFGCCLALRVAQAAPGLLHRLLLINPATSFSRSLNGLSALVSSTQLLSFFPQDWYQVAQKVLLPTLVDIDRVGPVGIEALKSMIMMEPPADFLESRVPTSPLEDRSWTVPVLTRGRAFGPAAAANFRANLLRTGDIPDHVLRRIPTRTLVICSARDRLLPSLTEGARLQRVLPRARRLILPDSGHAPTLERDFNLSELIRSTSFGPGPQMGGGLQPRDKVEAASTRVMVGVNHEDSGVRVVEVPSTVGRVFPSEIEVDRVGQEAYSPVSGGKRGGPSRAVADAGTSTSTLGAPIRDKTAGNVMSTSTAEEEDLSLYLHGGINLAEDHHASGGGGGASSADRQIGDPGGEEVPGLDINAASSGTRGVDDGCDVWQHQEERRTDPVRYRSTSNGSIYPPRSREGATMAAGDSGGASASQCLTSQAGSVRPNPDDEVNEPCTSTSGRAQASPQVISQAGTSSSTSKEELQHPSLTRPYTKTMTRYQTPLNFGTIDTTWDQWSQLLMPWRELISPVVLGLEHLPDPLAEASQRPVLFVGNHQKMGLYDLPLLMYELYVRGYKVKGLAHPGHWSTPLGPFFERFGAVKAGPMAAYRLLRANEKVLLFPGGAKEVNKRQAQEYQLLWKDSPDFVRLAIKCRALIIPFSAVGADDAYDVMVETQELLASPITGPIFRGLLRSLDPSLDPQECVLPITRLPGVGLPTAIPVPNLQRLYFKFCPPVDTLGAKYNDPQEVEAMYEEVRGQVVRSMEELLVLRGGDSDNQVGVRLRKMVDKVLPTFVVRQPPYQV